MRTIDAAMYTLAFRSDGDGITMPGKLRNLYQSQKPEITISIHDRKEAYTTLDKIEGVVSITTVQDLSFDDIEIEFVGSSRTYVERLTTAAAVSGRSEAFHQFLKLQQPRLHNAYPRDRILKANQKYEFPFVFVIPAQLLPRICQHPVLSPTLRDVHLQLPPSFGDKESALGARAVDDMVPDMASIRYGIFARLTKNKIDRDEVIRATIVAKAKRLRVMPAVNEQPPLDIYDQNSEFIPRKERTVRKGVLKGKLGTLVVETSQPPSMRLQARNSQSSDTTSTVNIMLRFDPADENAPPPRLGNIATKMRIFTYFASTARSKLPDKLSSVTDLTLGLHTDHLNLSSRCVANVEWIKHDPLRGSTSQRRDSAYSILSPSVSVTPQPSAAYKGKSYYVAQLIVPVTLPSHKSFVPTFHSCLISRTYQLKLELGLPNVGLGGTVGLKVPLQISCEAPTGDSPLEARRDSIDPALQAEMDDEDLEDFFEPRMIHAPSGEYIGRSRIGSQAPVDDAPPGYSFLAPPTTANDARVPVY